MSTSNSCSIVSFLRKRETGKRCVKRRLEELAERKATLPNLNLACESSLKTKSTFLLVFSHDKLRLASAHGDHTVRVTEIMSGRTTHVLSGLERTPWTLAFHPSNSEVLAGGCLGGVIHIWDLKQNGAVCDVWHTPDYAVVSSVAFHPNDTILVIATGQYIYFWDYSSSKEPFARISTPASSLRVRWLKFDPFGHYLYTGINNPVLTLASDSSDEEENLIGRRATLQRARPYRLGSQAVAEHSRSQMARDERQVVRVVNATSTAEHVSPPNPSQRTNSVTSSQDTHPRESSATENLHLHISVINDIFNRRINSSTTNDPSSSDEEEGDVINSVGERRTPHFRLLGPLSERFLNQSRSRHTIQLNGLDRMPPSFSMTMWPEHNVQISTTIRETTYRIDRWDLRNYVLPDIEKMAKKKPVFNRCKLHFDASLSMSDDGRRLALLVPGNRVSSDEQSINIISLRDQDLGCVLVHQSVSPNVVSLSLSPLSNYIVVGLSSKRMQWLPPPKQLIAQIYKIEKNSLEHVCDISHPSHSHPRFLVSVNAVSWLPAPGDGIVYGTNRGHLHICRPGLDERHPLEGSSTSVGGAQLVRVRLSKGTQTD